MWCNNYDVTLVEKDWEDIKHMPEYTQLMKDFGRQRQS